MSGLAFQAHFRHAGRIFGRCNTVTGCGCGISIAQVIISSMRIVALPFSRQRWLYAVSSTGQILAAAPQKPAAGGFMGWAQNAISSASQKAQNMLRRQWEGLEHAPAGSIRNRLHRLALSVLAREDVTESFLKTIPTNMAQLQIIAPADQKVGAASAERYVRRRTRLMLQQQERLHQCRMASWLSAIVPTAPLALLPVPNIPMYYAGYRAWSHWRALQGARKAMGLFQEAQLAHTARVRQHQDDGNRSGSEGITEGPAPAVVIYTAPDLDAAARIVSSVHEDNRAPDLADVALRYDLPDLQGFYQRALRQDRKK